MIISRHPNCLENTGRRTLHAVLCIYEKIESESALEDRLIRYTCMSTYPRSWRMPRVGASSCQKIISEIQSRPSTICMCASVISYYFNFDYSPTSRTYSRLECSPDWLRQNREGNRKKLSGIVKTRMIAQP